MHRSAAQPLRTPGEVTYTTPVLHRPVRLAGPIGATLRAAADRPDTLWALTLEDVAPDGTSVDITGGAQLGSLRAVDTSRSWPGTPGTWISPYHPLTAASRRPVPIGAPVRYDIQIRPAFATVPAGHRLRLRVGTADFPHLIPLADLPGLLGGRYSIRHDAGQLSNIELTVLS